MPAYFFAKWLQILEDKTGLPFALFEADGRILGRSSKFIRDEGNTAVGVSSSIDDICRAQRWQRTAVSFAAAGGKPVYLVLQAPETPSASLLPAFGRLLKFVADRDAAHEHEMENLSQEILDRYEELNLFYELAEELGVISEDAAIYEKVIAKTAAVLKAEFAALSLAKAGATYGTFSEDQTLGLQADIKRLMQKSLETQQHLLIENAEDFRRHVAESEGDGRSGATHEFSLLVSPLLVKDQCLGAIAVGRSGENGFAASDQKLLMAMSAMAAVALHNSQLLDKLKQDEIARHELQLAENIQKNMLPQQPPDLAGLEVGSLYLAANKVGGDYLDWLEDNRGNLNLVIADVSGHNIGAAMMMAVTRSVIRSNIYQGRGPDAVLIETNNMIYEDLDRSSLFVSAVVCNYNPKLRILDIAIAGHNPPLLYRCEQQSTQWLESKCFFLGLEKELPLENELHVLGPGDILFLYTDGLIEAANAAGERFEMDRLASAVKAAADLPVSELVQRISRQVVQFRGGELFDDDISVLVLKVL